MSEKIIMICPHCQEWKLCTVFRSEPGEGHHFGPDDYIAAAQIFPVLRVWSCSPLGEEEAAPAREEEPES